MAKAADAKAPKPLSESFDADDEGWLDRLIADEDEPDRATLWRLGSWAIAAVIALTLGLMSGQLPDGAKRSELAEAELRSQAQRIEGLARDTRQETRRIAAAVETLNSDRDRLFGRITSVEQNLDSVTGSIAKQAASAIAPALAKPPEPSANPPAEGSTPPSPAPVATAPAEKQKDTPAKDVLKEASKEPAKDTPKAGIASQSQAQTTLPAENTSKKADRSDGQRQAASPAASAETPAATDAPPQQSQPAEQVDAATTTTVAKPAPGQQVASNPPAVITAAPLTPLSEDAVAAAAENDMPVERTQFGLDLGGASSMTGLRALWGGVRKAHPSQLAALRPVLAIHPGKNGLGLQVHVIAGPIPDAAAAAKLCAMLAADDRECETAVFDGQRLLPDTDDVKKKPAPPAKPSRRKQAHHEPAAAAPASPPPADNKTSMLSFLGIR